MKVNWQKKPLNEIGEVISGGTPPTGNSEYWDGDIVWITPADLSKVKYPLIDDSLRRITRAGVLNSGTTIIPRNSIVMSSRAPIGYFAVPQVEFTTNQGCKSIAFHQGHDPIYHYYNLIFRVSRFKNRGEGTTFAEVSKKVVEKLEFEFPPLPQQRKIARILSTCDAVIEKTEAAIAKYRALKQGLMHDLFTRGIDLSTGHLRPKYEDAPELYKESELGWIPKEWEVSSLGEDNKSYAGGTPNRSIPKYYKGHIPWVSSGEVNKPFIYDTKERITKEAYQFSAAKMVPAESVLIAMYGATAGQVSMLKINSTTNQAVLAIIPSAEWNNYFIYYGLLLAKARIIYQAQGSGQPNLNKQLVDSTLFWYPSLSEQHAIAGRIKNLEDKLNAEESSLSKYRQLKAGLMQDLLTPPAAGQDGKVEVSVEGTTDEKGMEMINTK